MPLYLFVVLVAEVTDSRGSLCGNPMVAACCVCVCVCLVGLVVGRFWWFVFLLFGCVALLCCVASAGFRLLFATW